LKAIIIGAGPCGLTAAWDLVRAGVEVTVIEKESGPGGLCSTTRRGGFQFDLGGHRFISKDRQLVEDMKRLLGERMLTRRRKSVIRFKDRQFDYPLNVPNVLSQSSPWISLKFMAGYAAARTGIDYDKEARLREEVPPKRKTTPPPDNTQPPNDPDDEDE